ncbi:PQQ-binding-like beta-propeller repeat protein [Shigella flexneri]
MTQSLHRFRRWTVAGGHVYVGSEKVQVYGPKTSDGTVHGRPPSRVKHFAPVVSDGMVLIHTSNGQSRANQADGAVKWTVNPDMPALSLRGESAPRPLLARLSWAGTTVAVSAVLMEQGQMIRQQRISLVTG